MAVDNGAGVWYNGYMNTEHGAETPTNKQTAYQYNFVVKVAANAQSGQWRMLVLATHLPETKVVADVKGRDLAKVSQQIADVIQQGVNNNTGVAC